MMMLNTWLAIGGRVYPIRIEGDYVYASHGLSWGVDNQPRSEVTGTHRGKQMTLRRVAHHSVYYTKWEIR